MSYIDSRATYVSIMASTSYDVDSEQVERYRGIAGDYSNSALISKLSVVFLDLKKVAIACHFFSKIVSLPFKVDLYFSNQSNVGLIYPPEVQ